MTSPEAKRQRRAQLATDPEWAARERARQREAKRRARAADPERYREIQQRYRNRHQRQERERMRVYGQQVRSSDRTTVFAHYGQACACCGTGERLTIDHVDGTGRQHREELFGRNRGVSDKFYRWLIKNGLPAGYQVLCLRCNRSKGDGSVCQLDHAISPPLHATSPGGRDPLFIAADAAFPGVATGGPLPSLLAIRRTLGIGQLRARRAQDYLRAVQEVA